MCCFITEVIISQKSRERSFSFERIHCSLDCNVWPDYGEHSLPPDCRCDLKKKIWGLISIRPLIWSLRMCFMMIRCSHLCAFPVRKCHMILETAISLFWLCISVQETSLLLSGHLGSFYKKNIIPVLEGIFQLASFNQDILQRDAKQYQLKAELPC